MNFIIDPISLNHISIYTNQGKTLLKRYISHYQLGGTNNVEMNIGSSKTKSSKTALKHKGCWKH